MAANDQAPEWGANQLRLTAFLTPTANMDATQWWERLTGDTPDAAISNPKLATQETRGEFAGGTLILRTQPLRIDWMHAPVMPEGLPTIMETLGPFPDSAAAFVKVMQVWLAGCPPLQRLAFGAVLLHPVESRQAGYVTLSRYLHSVRLDVEHSSDFSYQINRVRQSNAIPDLPLNRLSKWAVSAVQSFTATGTIIGVGDRQHLCRLELDINTHPEPIGELLNGKLIDLLHELVSLAAEIAERGDVP